MYGLCWGVYHGWLLDIGGDKGFRWFRGAFRSREMLLSHVFVSWVIIHIGKGVSTLILNPPDIP